MQDTVEKYKADIIEMVKGINNIDYLARIYYFTLAKYEKEKKQK